MSQTSTMVGVNSQSARCPSCHGPSVRVTMPALLRPLRLLLPAATARRCGWQCGWTGLKLTR